MINKSDLDNSIRSICSVFGKPFRADLSNIMYPKLSYLTITSLGKAVDIICDYEDYPKNLLMAIKRESAAFQQIESPEAAINIYNKYKIKTGDGYICGRCMNTGLVPALEGNYEIVYLCGCGKSYLPNGRPRANTKYYDEVYGGKMQFDWVPEDNKPYFNILMENKK